MAHSSSRQTTPVVPGTCNQPQSPSAGSQIALSVLRRPWGESKDLNPRIRATQPVLEIADADRDPIENNDCISDSSEDVLTPGGYSTYGYRVTSIIENTTSGTDAVHELKSLGSEVFRLKETWSLCLEPNPVNREDCSMQRLDV